MRSDMKWLSLVSPLERLGHGVVSIFLIGPDRCSGMAHLLFAHDLPCRPVMVGWRWGAQEKSDGGVVRGDTPRVRVRRGQHFGCGPQVWCPPTDGARGDREFDPDAAASERATAADDRPG